VLAALDSTADEKLTASPYASCFQTISRSARRPARPPERSRAGVLAQETETREREDQGKGFQPQATSDQDFSEEGTGQEGCLVSRSTLVLDSSGPLCPYRKCAGRARFGFSQTLIPPAAKYLDHCFNDCR